MRKVHGYKPYHRSDYTGRRSVKKQARETARPARKAIQRAENKELNVGLWADVSKTVGPDGCVYLVGRLASPPMAATSGSPTEDWHIDDLRDESQTGPNGCAYLVWMSKSFPPSVTSSNGSSGSAASSSSSAGSSDDIGSSAFSTSRQTPPLPSSSLSC